MPRIIEECTGLVGECVLVIFREYCLDETIPSDVSDWPSLRGSLSVVGADSCPQDANGGFILTGTNGLIETFTHQDGVTVQGESPWEVVTIDGCQYLAVKTCILPANKDSDDLEPQRHIDPDNTRYLLNLTVAGTKNVNISFEIDAAIDYSAEYIDDCIPVSIVVVEGGAPAAGSDVFDERVCETQCIIDLKASISQSITLLEQAIADGDEALQAQIDAIPPDTNTTNTEIELTADAATGITVVLTDSDGNTVEHTLALADVCALVLACLPDDEDWAIEQTTDADGNPVTTFTHPTDPMSPIVITEDDTTATQNQDGSWTITPDGGDPITIPAPAAGVSLTMVDADGNITPFDPANDCIPRGAFQKISDHEGNSLDAAGCDANELVLHRSLVIGEDHVGGATGVGGGTFVGVSSTDSGDGAISGITTHHLYTAVSAQGATVSGSHSIVSGLNNEHSGVRGFTTGLRNETSGVSAITAGADNVNAGNNSIVAGNTNNLDASANSMVSGDQNVVTGASNNSVVTGSSNNVDASGRGFIGGTENTVTTSSNNSVVVGISNTIDDSGNTVVAGDTNTIINKSNNGIVAGVSNVLDDSGRNLVAGTSNSLTDVNHSIVSGSLHSATSFQQVAILGGQGITATQSDTAFLPFAVLDPAYAPPVAPSVPGQIYQPGGPGTALFW